MKTNLITPALNYLLILIVAVAIFGCKDINVSPKQEVCTFILTNKCTSKQYKDITWERSKYDTTVFIVKNLFNEYWVSTNQISNTKWELPALTITQLVGSKNQTYSVVGEVEKLGDIINIHVQYKYPDNSSQFCHFEGTKNCVQVEIPNTDDNWGN